MKINKEKLRQIISEEVASLLGEKKDKVSKKISYLMDKEDMPHKQAVAEALNMVDEGKLEEGFPGAELVSQFIGFIQQNPEVAVAAISANAAALGIAEMLESLADKVREGLANRESDMMKEAEHEDEKGDDADDEDALVLRDPPDIKRMKQGLKRISRPRSPGDFRSNKERFIKP